MKKPMKQENIRNFCIIAHIDHGKSTLADRLMELTQGVKHSGRHEQALDDMDIERERGITIKARAVTLQYQRPDGIYELNLIDTPGHVDFSYEVSRSLAACDGAILLVDASQGIEAQTLANYYLAIEQNLEVIPVMNKLDLPHARPDEVAQEIEDTFGYPAEDVGRIIAKTGEGVDKLLDFLVDNIQAPEGNIEAPTRALIFDTVYDDYQGVIVYFRVVDGILTKRDKIRMVRTGRNYDIVDIGIFEPARKSVKELQPGQVGYLTCHIRDLSEVSMGDTITLDKFENVEPLPGYQPMKQMVFCSIFPTDNADYKALRTALEKLQLNDAAFTFNPITSVALGFGFRCGFLGMLHMEIVRERLEREGNVAVIQTAPNVTFKVVKKDGVEEMVDNPTDLPDPGSIEEIHEPIVRMQVMVPQEYIGAIMTLSQEKRGEYVRTEYITSSKVMLVYDIPMAEILFDYYDKLKSCTRGYGTMDFEFKEFRKGTLVKLDILIADEVADALSVIVHSESADRIGRSMLKTLKKEIPRHMFKVALQAAVGAKIIARETISAMSKNVTAKCYGGDISRKRKLLEKQKEGKKKMKAIGSVNVPQAAFMAVLKVED